MTLDSIQLISDGTQLLDTKGIIALNRLKNDLSEGRIYRQKFILKNKLNLFYNVLLEQLEIFNTVKISIGGISSYFQKRKKSLTKPRWTNILRKEQKHNNSCLNSGENLIKGE